LAILAVVIVKKFGKLIVSALTIVGALVVAVLVWALVNLFTGGLDFQTIKTIWEVVR
jgi:hypothetical protein